MGGIKGGQAFLVCLAYLLLIASLKPSLFGVKKGAGYILLPLRPLWPLWPQ